MIIIGEFKFLELSSGQFILSGFKIFLISNNLVKKIGIPNILIQNASTVGALDLGFYSISNGENFIFLKN